MITGIYCIENKINGKKYIGKAKNIKKRWADHIRKLNKGTHDNKYLLTAWEKYGRENFDFNIIELCEIDKLIEREIFYISFFDTFNHGYNLTVGGDGLPGYKHSSDTKKIMSEKASGRIITKEQIEKRKETISNWSDEEKEIFHKNLSEGHKGQVVSAETREILSNYFKNNPSRKKGVFTHTEESKKKTSESMKRYYENKRKEADQYG